MSKEEPPELCASFHTARRSYAFYSSLLIIWKTAKAIPSDILNVKLPTIKVLPYILVSIVVYFAFRTTIEWRQSNLQRRNMIPSKVDFAIAHCIGIVAIICFIFIIDTQGSYNNVITQLFCPLVLSVTMVCFVGYIIYIYEKQEKSRWWEISIIVLSSIILIILIYCLTKNYSSLSGLLFLGVTPLLFAIYLELRKDLSSIK